MARVRQCLKAFDFDRLFVEELGWDRYGTILEVTTDGRTYALAPVAQKRGMVAYTVTAGSADGGRIPDYPSRRKIEHQVTKSAREHLVVYVDAATTIQVWQWVKREPGKPTACRDHTFHRDQPGDALIQKLQTIAFGLEEEADLTLVDVTSRVRAGFDIEKVTKRFYEYFRTEHAAFLKFLRGVPDAEMQRWYVSVMLDRLMFIYFIQRKGFLDANPNYLGDKLAASKARGNDRFYREFLCPLFFEGFARKENERSGTINKLLGKVPYLNGGLFLKHQIEEFHGRAIDIADAAFGRLFEFFDRWQWHLDERPLRKDDEINPDVLGYIFEKYINQKQMGAYYTKEDITGYISRNTIIPFLFDAARAKCKIAFEGEQSIWRLLAADPDRYIYPALRRGVIDEEGKVIPETALPGFVRKGMHDPKARMFNRDYNLGRAVILGADESNLALPTETWREYVERRTRCLDLRSKLSRGEVRDINDMITLNLDIQQFAQDVIEDCEGPELLRAFWHAIIRMTVLDPTCGSGAFLFAALNILESLYEACLDRMEVFLTELDRSGEKHRPEKFSDFRKIIDRVEKHPNRKYFVFKSIVINNLYGVDIMEEAVEICKLRLFLKLVAQIERPEQIEPLPDIDFNIRAGNTLVGYATYEQVRNAVRSKLDFDNTLTRIEQRAEDVDRLFTLFRQQQTELGGTVTALDKQELRKRLSVLENDLNRYLATEYRIDPAKKATYAGWLLSQKPFHWFVEFYGIMKTGGFDVVIGNPPYIVYPGEAVEYDLSQAGYTTLSTKNLYAFVYERSIHLTRENGIVGLIVQLTSLSSEKMPPMQDLLLQRGHLQAIPFPRRPESVFEGVEMPVAILLSIPKGERRITTSRINRFYTEERDTALKSLGIVSHDVRLDGHRIAKLGRDVETQICRKVLSQRSWLDALTNKGGRHILWYQEACRYWAKAFDHLPFFKRDGNRMDPPHGRTVGFGSKDGATFAACLLNSSLFYWFYSAFSDCEHINDGLIRGFRIPTDWQTTNWIPLCADLSASIQANAKRKVINTKQGHVIEYDEINASASKTILDEIDLSLAKKYGLSDEELDFIVNYDIKYRLGANSDEDEE